MDTILKQRKGIKKKHIPFIAGGLFLLIVLLWTLFGDHSRKMRVEKQSVSIGNVANGDFSDYIRLNGQVQPATLIQISAQESGIVHKILLEEGAILKPQDTILILRNPSLMQQMLDSETQLGEKKNMLRDTEISMEKEKLNSKQNMLTTMTQANRSRRSYEQQKSLYGERLTSKEEYLRAEEDYLLNENQLIVLKDKLYQDSLYRNVQLSKIEETLRNTFDNLMLVRQRNDNLNILATHEGQLGSFDVRLGQNIAAGTLIGQINVLGNYKIQVNIDEHYIDRIAVGLEGVFERQGSEYAVRVNRVYPEVRGSQFRADMTFIGDVPDNIRVGQTYYIKLQLGEPVKSLLIPRGNFFTSTGGKWIFVVSEDGSRAVKRSIRIGRQNPQYYEVLEGLNEGETVIVSGYDTFGDVEKLILK